MKPALDVVTSVAGLSLVVGRDWVARQLGLELMVVAVFLGAILAIRGVFLALFAGLNAWDQSRRQRRSVIQADMLTTDELERIMRIANEQIYCPRCRQPSDSIKRYPMIDHVLFLVLVIQVQRVEHTACPPCMRQEIGDHLVSPARLLGGNILWPLMILLPGLIQLLGTFVPGHSRAIRKALKASMAATRQDVR